MKKELFNELMESIKEGGAILRGKAAPKRSHKYDEPNVRAIREKLGLSQDRFSVMLGISPATLRNWEQGRSHPDAPTRVLLAVIAKHPEAVEDVLRKAS